MPATSHPVAGIVMSGQLFEFLVHLVISRTQPCQHMVHDVLRLDSVCPGRIAQSVRARALQARCRRFEPVCAHGLVGLWCLVVCLVGGWLVSACPAECAGVGRSVVECCWFTGYRILGVSQGRSLPGKGVRQVYVREHTLDGCHVI